MFMRVQLPGIWTATAILATLRAQAGVPAPIVDLGYAQYQGSVNASTNVTSFFGIRYAAAPVGDLRFSAPQPPANVTGVQDATTQPNECFQAGSGVSAANPLRTRAIDSSEDCLFLNVYYPSDAEGVPLEDLPVVVWIHGGGFVGGAASQYRGSDLIAQSNRGLVAVMIQYRLGLFGFLPGTEVKKNGALNAGLLDQDFALRWVREHISKFGGDPSKVTIWGESAGAGSVLLQMIANNGNTEPQLFRGAISSSNYLGSQYAYDDPIPESLYSEVVAQTNCTGAADSMACLRAADAGTLQTANVGLNNAAFSHTFLFVPVVDGTFITQRPLLSLAQGKKSLMVVTNAFEGTNFVNQTATINATDYAFQLFPKFTEEQAHEVGEVYAPLGTQLFQKNAIMGESIFTCSAYALINSFSGNLFKGEFAVPPGTHGADVSFYFPSFTIDVPAANKRVYNNTQFVDAFAQSFTAFVISQDPNMKISDTILPRWDGWDPVGRTEMLFNRTDAGIPDLRQITTSDALLERCQFWASLGQLTGH
ncbi:Carboxylic ester hydrolase [Mycena venus]|uniref:Carboxylic ester hydrolase n=1 Tax=Mycena venus TaxID=2733690 RepID=A0A8H6Y1B1_9AGAR|nr:Carboxylic ester hydrolase [Mycena venus]